MRKWSGLAGCVAVIGALLVVGCSDDSSGGEGGDAVGDTAEGGDAGEEGQPDGEEGQPDGEEGQPDGEEGQPDGEEGQPDGEEGQPDGEEGQPDGEEGQPDGEEGQPDGEEGQPDGEEGGEGLDCATYCSLITTACSGDDAQYADEAACLTYCNDVAPWSVGTADDTSGNTLGCRIYHATVAGTMDANVHCPHAGPTGGGVCGDWCDDYCALVQSACTGGNAQYADAAACKEYCTNVASWEAGTPGDMDGNSISCRMYHAGAAAQTNPEVHCPHAGPTGANVCGTWCDNYCDLAANNCTEGNAIYASEGDCATACEGLATDGMIGDTSGDSIQCRIYHLGAAAGDAAVHCPHGAEDGGGVCVDATAITYSGPGGAQAAFQTSCVPCHQGATVAGCSGGACLASFYEATQLPSIACAGKNMAECSLERAKNGSMPPGPTNAPQDVIDTIEAWIMDGQLP